MKTPLEYSLKGQCLNETDKIIFNYNLSLTWCGFKTNQPM